MKMNLCEDRGTLVIGEHSPRFHSSQILFGLMLINPQLDAVTWPAWRLLFGDRVIAVDPLDRPDKSQILHKLQTRLSHMGGNHADSHPISAIVNRLREHRGVLLCPAGRAPDKDGQERPWQPGLGLVVKSAYKKDVPFSIVMARASSVLSAVALPPLTLDECGLTEDTLSNPTQIVEQLRNDYVRRFSEYDEANNKNYTRLEDELPSFELS